MSCIAANGNILVVAKGLHVDCYDLNNHYFFTVQNKTECQEDFIADIAISSDNNYLAFITSVSKQLLICNLPKMDKCTSATLPRSASKIRFTVNNEQILVCDKSGDVLIYNVEDVCSGTKLLGHLSLLLDVLQTSETKYIISCDRDEKIKVSCYPNTYNIQTYCLGHKEFVNHIELLPHNNQFLTSSSGDGTIKVWDYLNGRLCYSINTNIDVDDENLNKDFAKQMDEEGVDVVTLPIVHYAITKVNDNTSLLAVTLHSFNKVIIYSLHTENNHFKHKLEDMLTTEQFPSAIVFNDKSLILYNNLDNCVSIMSIVNTNNKISFQLMNEIKMHEDRPVNFKAKTSLEVIKVLYKRKYDNVQEYQERKKQRLEKSLK